MEKPLSKTALKFLACVHPKHGTHAYNLKSYYAKLDDGGYIHSDKFPFVHLTNKGREALKGSIEVYARKS